MEAGYCKFCGQAYRVEADQDATTEELNELATDKCGCDASARYAWKKSTLEVFAQDLEVVFGENEAMKGLFAKAGEMIMDNRIKTITVKQSDEKTLGLKMKSMGLCITVTEKSKMENISYG